MEQRPYYTFRQHLFEQFAERVHRVPINAGFTCPNRDGTKGRGGCIYCNASGSGVNRFRSDYSIREQLITGIDRIRKRFKARKFIAYFQSFSNTYGSVDRLREIYREALSVPDVVGISIGTRPDVVPDPILDMIEEFAQNTYVWIEYGLQSIHQASLDWMNRGHSFAEFKDAIIRTQSRSILTAAHIILGLPGESRKDMQETAETVAQLPLDGLKIHHLYIPTDSPIEELYRTGKVKVLDEDAFVELVVDVIELLPPTMVIHRVMGDSNPKRLVAPLWTLHKAKILQKIDAEFKRRGACQGYRYNKPDVNSAKIMQNSVFT